MSKDYDLDEQVTIVSKAAAAKPDDVDTLRPVVQLSLREAVRTIIEDWDGDTLRQLSIYILRDSGSAIATMDEVRTIYAQTKRSPSA